MTMDLDESGDSNSTRRLPTEDEEIDVPRHFEWEIRDLVHPITLRRVTLWRIGLLVGALAVAGLVAWAVFLRPPSGEALLSDVVEAAGGEANWNAVKAGSFTRVHTWYDEDGTVSGTERETFYFDKAGEFRLVIEAETNQGEVVIGRDDDGYWATMDGVSGDPREIAHNLGMMCDSEKCSPICAAEMAFYRFSMPFKLTDPGVIPDYAGETTLNGRPVSKLSVTYEGDIGGDRWVLFVDQESKLVRKVEHYPVADGNTPPEEFYWTDYQTAGGLTFSHQRSYYRSNGTKLEEYTITDVDFSSEIPDEQFARPDGADTQPVAEASLEQ